MHNRRGVGNGSVRNRSGNLGEGDIVRRSDGYVLGVGRLGRSNRVLSSRRGGLLSRGNLGVRRNLGLGAGLRRLVGDRRRLGGRLVRGDFLLVDRVFSGRRRWLGS